MSVVAVRTGFGFVVVLGILGIAQPQVVTDSLLLFATAGLIPGTNIEISPDLTLLMVGASLMAITVLLCREYAAYRASLEVVMPEYMHQTDEDDAAPVNPLSGLRRVVLAGRSAMYVASDLTRDLYYWLRSFGRPIVAQIIALHTELTTALVRFDPVEFRINTQESLEIVIYRLRNWTREGVKLANILIDKTLTYYIRLTLL